MSIFFKILYVYVLYKTFNFHSLLCHLNLNHKILSITLKTDYSTKIYTIKRDYTFNNKNNLKLKFLIKFYI